MENEDNKSSESEDSESATEVSGEINPEHLSSETAQEIDESNEVEGSKKVEAALFISARFLNLQELVMLTDVNPLMLKELIEKLIEKYNREESAIEIISKNNMWKMDVRQEYVKMINKLATGSAEFTKAEQETLAVIAYKQPVKQSVIIKIRGNKAYEHIKKFRDVGLVHAKRTGHTLELTLSDEFFEYFHLQKKGQGMEIEKNGGDDGDVRSEKVEGDEEKEVDGDSGEKLDDEAAVVEEKEESDEEKNIHQN